MIAIFKQKSKDPYRLISSYETNKGDDISLLQYQKIKLFWIKMPEVESVIVSHCVPRDLTVNK